MENAASKDKSWNCSRKFGWRQAMEAMRTHKLGLSTLPKNYPAASFLRPLTVTQAPLNRVRRLVVRQYAVNPSLSTRPSRSPRINVFSPGSARRVGAGSRMGREFPCQFAVLFVISVVAGFALPQEFSWQSNGKAK